MLYHLKPTGVMATVLANGSLSSNTGGEGEIRKKLIQNGLVEAIVALPKQLFYNTGIPACIRFLRRGRKENTDKILFIDASEMGFMKDRVHRELSDEDIAKIADTYHHWRKGAGYEDELGYAKSAQLPEVEAQGFVLTPGRYVGIPEAEDDGIPFEEKMKNLTTTLADQFAREQELNQEIKNQLSKLGFYL